MDHKLGITDDEITAGEELLDIAFSKPVSITQLGFLDLFGFPNQSGDSEAETARWTVYHPSPSLSQSGSATGTDQTTTLGYLAVNTSYTNVTRIRYFASTPLNSDFSVASIRISVPEPATLLLAGLGVALVSLGARRRRIV